MVRLAPGVGNKAFSPGAGGAAIRERLGIGEQSQVVLCVSRLVPRKGQDTLIRAWPRVLAAMGGQFAQPSPVLLIVGDGPYGRKLRKLARRLKVTDSVIFAGSVTSDELPAYYDAGTVFAMPCRTRRFGLDVEGLGIVYLEASATGLPVIGGDSGGAPDAILPGETGYVVAGGDVAGLAERLIGLLSDPQGAATMGDKGLAWVDQEWRWDLVSRRLDEILSSS
jgi:phosphatidylinositol alpha-1,6-mannosyltransferase